MSELEILNHIRSLRESKGLTQPELAKQVGISLRTYQRIESGMTSIKVYQLIDILSHLDPAFSEYFLNYFGRDQNIGENESETKIMNGLAKNVSIRNAPVVASDSKEIEIVKSSMVRPGIQNIGYWEWNPSNSFFFWSEEMYALYDYKKDDQWSFEDLCQKVHPDDVPGMKQSLERMLTDNKPYHSIHRVFHSTQGCIQVEAYARVLKQVNEEVVFGIAGKRV